jgi:signal transduction histidine kinase
MAPPNSERLPLEGLTDQRHDAELRRQFVAVLGHDLRNPPAAIEGGINGSGAKILV